MMDLLKLVAVFASLVLVLRFNKPLHLAIIVATLSTVLLFKIPVDLTLKSLIAGATSWSTIQLLLVLYLITFLQKMLQRKGDLQNAKDSIDNIFKNRRISTSVAPMILGMMPSVATVFICADFVKPNTDGYLEVSEQAAVTSFFRHISELFFPTYASILVAINLTEGRVAVGTFVLLMLPMVLALLLIGRFIYLRKIPKEISHEIDSNLGDNWKLLLTSLWTVIAIVVLIIAFELDVWLSVLIILIIYMLINKFNFSSLKKIAVEAFETNLMLNMLLIMVFKEILSSANVIQELPALFESLPIPGEVIMFLLFLFGTMISGSQAMIVLGIPIAIETIAPGQSFTPLFILLMCTTYATMQLTPIHVCLPACAEYYDVGLGTMIRKTIPMIFTFLVVSIVYYFVLLFLGV